MKETAVAWVWHHGIFVVWLFFGVGLEFFVLFFFFSSMGQGRIFINDLGLILPSMLYRGQFI